MSIRVNKEPILEKAMLNITKEVAEMKRLTVNELRIRYADAYGEWTNARNKEWLVKRIAWRMQANCEGDLSERARQRAAEIANDADIRTTAPKQPTVTRGAQQRTIRRPTSLQDPDCLYPGLELVREYKGQEIRVIVVEGGFEYEGERYKSLTAVARVVTGQHWNGFQFFGLRKKATAK